MVVIAVFGIAVFSLAVLSKKLKHEHHYDWKHKTVTRCGGDWAYCKCGRLFANHYCLAGPGRKTCVGL